MESKFWTGFRFRPGPVTSYKNLFSLPPDVAVSLCGTQPYCEGLTGGPGSIGTRTLCGIVDSLSLVESLNEILCMGFSFG